MFFIGTSCMYMIHSDYSPPTLSYLLLPSTPTMSLFYTHGFIFVVVDVFEIQWFWSGSSL